MDVLKCRRSAEVLATFLCQYKSLLDSYVIVSVCVCVTCSDCVRCMNTGYTGLLVYPNAYGIGVLHRAALGEAASLVAESFEPG